MLLAPDLQKKIDTVTQGGEFSRPERIFACDMEDRADLWLSSATAMTKDLALVVCNNWLPKRRNGLCEEVSTGNTLVNCPIRTMGGWLGQAVVTVLAPGDSITVYLEHEGLYRAIRRLKSRRFVAGPGGSLTES